MLTTEIKRYSMKGVGCSQKEEGRASLVCVGSDRRLTPYRCRKEGGSLLNNRITFYTVELIGFLGRVNQALGGTEERLVGYYVAQSMTEQSFTNKVAGSSPAMVTATWKMAYRVQSGFESHASVKAESSILSSSAKYSLVVY